MFGMNFNLVDASNDNFLNSMITLKAFLFLTYFITAITSLQITLAFPSHAQLIYSTAAGVNPNFIPNPKPLQCNPDLYGYSQTQSQYSSNKPYQLTVTNNNLILSLTVKTAKNRFSPTLSSDLCNTAECTISLFNNCPSVLQNNNYFDTIEISIDPIGTFEFTLNCDISYNSTFFEYGGLVLIIVATVILILATYMGRWNSFNGYGIQYGYKMIGFVTTSILTVGLLGIFKPNATEILMSVVDTISIITAGTVIGIEGFYFMRTGWLTIEKTVFKLRFRVMDVLGFLFGCCLVGGWWAADRNWIYTDIMAIMLIIAIIKVFKFVSFKVALIAYLIMVAMYIAASVIIVFVYQNQYDSYTVALLRTPYQLKFPSFSEAYGQKCVWISITTVAFPGLLVSYLRRFDQSKSTIIYLLTAVVTYFIGSVCWYVANTLSYYSLPFDAFCEPIMIISFTLFAFKRKELRTLWEGKFFDEEFLDKKDIQALGVAMATEMTTQNPAADVLRDSLNQQLFFEIEEDSELEPSQRKINDGGRIANDAL